jgi:hypothetical protein
MKGALDARASLHDLVSHPENKSEFEYRHQRHGLRLFHGRRRKAAGRGRSSGTCTTRHKHTVILVWTGCDCRGLFSLHEIFAAAINTTPTRTLENTCGGIERIQNYTLSPQRHASRSSLERGKGGPILCGEKRDMVVGMVMDLRILNKAWTITNYRSVCVIPLRLHASRSQRLRGCWDLLPWLHS